MKSPETGRRASEEIEGSDRPGDVDALDGAVDAHAVDRLSLAFDMPEVMSEYRRALRASVPQLSHDSKPADDECDVEDLTRFHESIDQSLAKSVAS